MWDWVRIVGWSAVSALKSQRDLALENVGLRHQLMVLQRRPGRLQLKDRDRPFFGCACAASGMVGAEPFWSSNLPLS